MYYNEKSIATILSIKDVLNLKNTSIFVDSNVKRSLFVIHNGVKYEFKEIKPHPDIRVSQLLGDIYGNQSNPITFTYNPTTFTTAEAEFELRTSEFDFEPQVVRIVGSAIP